ncbi:hybrid sensor histidine kinase/response regulator [Paludisphaera mucosa]|uniref:histidine kinase n=1 Tax=Paludisphaera mucosa TaxID=3030827 RepID=A0ABT6FB05_9BACT|nr:ATP-binding protein [Paludisphaera mucosa]MDG3004777.1 ATP-binding protein [Paludisphaera mucosa]
MAEGPDDEDPSVGEVLELAQSVIAIVREPLVILDADLTVDQANDAFYEAFGLEPRSVEGRLIYDLGDRQWDIEELKTLLEDVLPGDSSVKDFAVEHDFGRLGFKTMLLNARKLHRDGRKILLAMEDVTDRRRAERDAGRSRELLDETTRFFAETLDALAGHIAVLDERGVILFVNAAWRRFGEQNGLVGDGSGVGRNYLDSCLPAPGSPAEDGGTVAGILDVIEGRRDDFACEYPCHPPGGCRWFTMRVSRFVRPGPVRVVVVHDDVTERRRAEAAVRGARDEAEAANRMKDDFLATLSHELRTPLSAILGWAKILKSGRVGEEHIQEGLAVIERNSVAQARIIEDILDVSRIVSGNLRIEAQRVRVQDVVEAAVAAAIPAATARGVDLLRMIDPLAAPAIGDASRLQQVVWNLVSNAVKFTPEGGSVRVSLGRVDSHLEIKVVDTGIGMSEDFLPHVFDRFRQADSSTTRRYGGLGLGLAIARQLVELHGGSLKAESPGEGRGSAFTVSLPIAAVNPGRPTPPESAPKPRGGAEGLCKDHMLDGVRVLVLDDEPDARHLIHRVLSACRAEVAQAASVREALELVESFRPDVVVSDVGMPDEDGYDFIRQVRSRRSPKELPAAALTAFARPEDRRRALFAGFQTHVAKPVDPEELLAVVASLAGRTQTT